MNYLGSLAPLRLLDRIKPQPHGILPLAENNYVTHAFDALHRVLHVHIEVVAQKQAVVLSLRVRARSQNESPACLWVKAPGFFPSFRQTPGRWVTRVFTSNARQSTSRLTADLTGTWL